MSGNDWALVAIVVLIVAFLWHVPLFKPWSGFRKPPNHRGRWFE